MSANRSALIVDDERDIRELLVLTLGRMGLQVDTAANLTEARELLAGNRYDLCFTDMRLPDGNGIELVGEIARRYPQTPVAMITAFGSMDLAVEALKAGAFDFVSKPVDINVLRGLVRHALELNNSDRPKPPPPPPEANRLLGQSPAMATLRATIAKVSRSQAPVYILGESGVGKELVAHTIHEQGARAAGPFVPVNCGAIPAELMESEFFGHRKGSFTGAHADKPGLFQAANGGTLFLDEVAELPLPMQVKLLRAIQEKSVRPVGAANEIAVDVRILSATHKDLSDLVADGRFRHDLYYRINVIELRVPPLRERTEDLPQLATAILQRLSAGQGRAMPDLTPAAQAALAGYGFPGNVRELENILERAMALADALPCELISVDSALIYRGMDIGTAKPSRELLARYPHRLIDIRDPAESYSAAEFRADALAAMAEATARGRIPLLVGGTMLYYKALLEGLADMPGADPEVRAAIEAEALAEGWEALHRQLAEVDPESAARIHPNDPQRLMRALEVYRLGGVSMSDLRRRQSAEKADFDASGRNQLPYTVAQLAIAPEQRQVLHARIAQRFRQMLEQGFIAEVEALHARSDLHAGLPSIRAVGYRQVWDYLDGKLSYAEMTERGIIATRQLAKRQFTWLRGEPDAQWFDPATRRTPLDAAVAGFLGSGG